MFRKWISMVLMTLLLLGAVTPAAMASGLTARSEYEGNGKVSLDFNLRVQYKNPSVVVTDSAGKTYSAKIIERDSDDLEFKATSLKAGKQYNYALSGIRKRGSGSYTTIKGTFRVPSAQKVEIQSIEYKSNGYVEIDFAQRVQYSGAKVSVTDSAGKKYTAKITERDDDDLKFKVTSIKGSKTYTFKISGIKVRGADSYTTVSGTFKTPEDGKPSIESTEYEGRGRVEVDFRGRVQYKNAKVTVKDSSGKSYSASITSKDSDDLTFKVKSIKSDKKYTFKISGIRLKGTGSYTSVSGSFHT